MARKLELYQRPNLLRNIRELGFLDEFIIQMYLYHRIYRKTLKFIFIHDLKTFSLS